MSVRRVVLSSFVLLTLARATCAVAEDSSNKAVLGPAVPISELLILKAGFDDEPEPLPPAPIPLLEPKPISIPPGLLLSPAEITIPEGYGMPGNGMLRATARITPSDEIALHLSQAVLSLTAAGLNEEAEQARSLLREFQAKHQPRLLLAAKQAQLMALQSEIRELTARVDPSQEEKQIVIHTTFASMATDRLKEFLDIPRHDEEELRGNGLSLVYSTIGSTADLKRKIKLGQADRTIQVNGAPLLLVRSGEPADMINGGEINTTVVGADGISKPVALTFGTSVRGTATIVEGDRVRLRLIAENSSARHRKNGEDKPQISGHQAATNLELQPGQTVVLGGVSAANHAKQWLVLLSAEIVEASDRPVKPSIKTISVTPAGIIESETVPNP